MDDVATGGRRGESNGKDEGRMGTKGVVASPSYTAPTASGLAQAWHL